MTRARTRSAGTVRKLPSGRWQARYYGPDGKRYNVHPSGGRSGTFEMKTHAKTALDKVLGEISAGKWRDPGLGSDVLREYAADWLGLRHLKPRTREHYGKVLDAHILPAFGDHRVDEITVDAVKRWYAKLGRTTGPTYRAHAYALLKSILRAAVDDGKIERNPCTVRGGGTAKTAKTVKVATPAEVDTIAANMPPPYAAMVLLGAWAALRFGEVIALRRHDLDLERAVVHVERGVVVVGGDQLVGDPKSTAGVREVAFHQGLVEPLRRHLAEHAQPGPDGLLFPSANGGYLRPATFWDVYDRARQAAGRPDLKFHDLRHTGITAYSKLPGVTIAELLRWSGQSTLSVSLRYQHPEPDDARALVQAMDIGAENVVPMRRRKGG